MTSKEVPHSSSDTNFKNYIEGNIKKAGSRFLVAPVENIEAVDDFNSIQSKNISCPVSKASSTNIDNILYILPHSKSVIDTQNIYKILEKSHSITNVKENIITQSPISSHIVVNGETSDAAANKLILDNVKQKHITIKVDSSDRKNDNDYNNNDKTENNSTYKKMMTYETLPNVEHYKNIFSMVKSKGRPSLTELHNQPRIPEFFLDAEQQDFYGNKKSRKRAPYNKSQHDLVHLVGSQSNVYTGESSQKCKRVGSDRERGISQGPKFGWIKGVLVRCILNIWGVMLFLRLSWVVGQAGVGLATVIVLLSVTVTTITSMSMSAICTNGEVKGGGAYYMISRSLGPEFGGAIGIIFSIANAIAVSMYIVGFAETVLDLIARYAGSYFGISETNWIRIIGCSTAILLLAISLAGMEWEAKAQVGLLVLLVIAIINFVIGSFLPPKDIQKSKGFLGYRMSLLRQNIEPAFGPSENFFSVFSIFFPAATGILAGANISGDLKNAQKAIPKGTFLAILITTAVYLFMIYVLGATSLREASGAVSDLFISNYTLFNKYLPTANPFTFLVNLKKDSSENIFLSYAQHYLNRSSLITDPTNLVEGGNYTTAAEYFSHSLFGNSRWPIPLLTRNPISKDFSNPLIQSCQPLFKSISGNQTSLLKPCQYGLLRDYQVVDMISLLGPITTIGIFAATLSSALASLVGAPKVFQALCRDNIFPGIKYFGQGSKKNDEPYRAYVLAFVIAILFILVAQLNLIAPIISNFFLMAYALINYSCFDASLSKSIGFRPSFKYFNKWISLFGAFLCLATMFLIQWWAAFLTFFFVISFYAYIRYKKPDVNWGSSTQANTYKNALNAVLKLNNIEEHVKNFRPQILALTGDPKSRPAFLDFVNYFTKNISLLICGHVVMGHSTQTYFDINVGRVYGYLRYRKVKALYNPVVASDIRSGVKSLLQLSGLGRMRPNIIMMGYKNNWESDDMDSLNQYFNLIHDAFDMRYGVGILRLKNGLDYSFFTNQYHQKQNSYRKRLQELDKKISSVCLEENHVGDSKLSHLLTRRNSPDNKSVKSVSTDVTSPKHTKTGRGMTAVDPTENSEAYVMSNEKGDLDSSDVTIVPNENRRVTGVNDRIRSIAMPNGPINKPSILSDNQIYYLGGEPVVEFHTPYEYCSNPTTPYQPNNAIIPVIQEEEDDQGTPTSNTRLPNFKPLDRNNSYPYNGEGRANVGQMLEYEEEGDQEGDDLDQPDFDFYDFENDREDDGGHGMIKNRSELFLNQYITKPFRRVMSTLNPNLIAGAGSSCEAGSKARYEPTAVNHMTTNENVSDDESEDNYDGYMDDKGGLNIDLDEEDEGDEEDGEQDLTLTPLKKDNQFHSPKNHSRDVKRGLLPKKNHIRNRIYHRISSNNSRDLVNPYKGSRRGSDKSSVSINFLRKFSKSSFASTLGLASQSSGGKSGKLSRGKFSTSSTRALQRFFEGRMGGVVEEDANLKNLASRRISGSTVAKALGMAFQYQEELPMIYRSCSRTSQIGIASKRTRKEATIKPPTSPNMDLKTEEFKAQRAAMIINKKRKHETMLFNKNILAHINQFHYKQKRGNIDVWWLFDDGGLTILLPYILSQRRNWESCKVRFFALSKNKKDLDIMHHNFAAMLTKFRIDYSDVIILPDIHHKPQIEGIEAFDSLVAKYRVQDENDPHYREGMITDAEYIALEQKTHRHIRLHEMLKQYSINSNLIVMTLPMPRKGTCSAALYMGWLEIMTRNLPPILLLRGNQQSVLTFYS